jgi:hypothetical protein
MPNPEIQPEGGGSGFPTIRDVIHQPEDGGGHWKKIIGILGLFLRKILGVFAVFAYTDKEKWIENMRGQLSVVATVIATISF